MHKRTISIPSSEPGTPPVIRRRQSDTEPLVDWREPERNAHVLDWRDRAHEFGLLPLEDTSLESSVVEPPSRLIEEEEPEAFDEARFDRDAEEPIEDDDRIDEFPASRVSQEDVDLVRVYLNHIGKRKLLKAHEEQDIGRRIEAARNDLLEELATIPSARQTLLSLADMVRTGRVPAAELILLPDGGELKAENVVRVMRRLRCCAGSSETSRRIGIRCAIGAPPKRPGPAPTKRLNRSNHDSARRSASCPSGHRSSTTSSRN